MLISFIEPIVYSQYLFYQLTVVGQSVRIYLGFISDNTNVENTWSTRNWCIKNVAGVVIRRGQIAIQLNTYNSFVDVVVGCESSGLQMGTAYTFNIENPVPYPIAFTTIISTVNPASVKVVDEKFKFVQSVKTDSIVSPVCVGDVRLVPVRGSPSVFFGQFPEDWAITRTEGNGLIFCGSQVYAYAPTAIYTRNRSVPPYIDFVPFPGLPSRRVVINQLPTIENQGNSLYSIVPPTRVKVSWRNTVLSQTDTYVSHDTHVAVGMVDVRQISGVSSVAGVRIIAIF